MQNHSNQETGTVYTPSAVIDECLQVAAGITARTVTVRGRIRKIRTGDSWASAQLGDDCTGQAVNLIFSHSKGNMSLFAQLQEDTERIITGSVTWRSSGDSIRLSMSPFKLDYPQEDDSIEGTERRETFWSEVLRRKRRAGYKNIYLAFKEAFRDGRQPVVALVRPRSDTALMDICRGLDSYKENFTLLSESCDFLSPKQIVDALDKADKGYADMVVLTRGGGAGLEVLDNRDVLNRLADMSKPVLVGLGHDCDYLMANTLADRCCALPFDIGACLKDIYTEQRNAYNYRVQYNDLKERYGRLLAQEKVREVHGRLGGGPAPSFYGLPLTDNRLVKWTVIICSLVGAVCLLNILL